MANEYKKPESMQEAIDNYRNYQSEYIPRIDSVNYALDYLLEINPDERENMYRLLECLRVDLLDEETGELMECQGGAMVGPRGIPDESKRLSIIGKLEAIVKKSS